MSHHMYIIVCFFCLSTWGPENTVHDPRSPPGIVAGQQRGLRFGGQGLVRRRDQAPGAEKGKGRMVVSYIYMYSKDMFDI